MYIGRIYGAKFAPSEEDIEAISEWKWCSDCKEAIWTAPIPYEIGDSSIPNGTSTAWEWKCPQCGNGELEDATKCPICGEYMWEEGVICESCMTDVNEALTDIAENLLKLDLSKKADRWLFEDIISDNFGF